MRDIYWFDLPMMAESHRVKKILNSQYEFALEPSKNLTEEFHKEMQIRGTSKQNIILSWFGTPRDGKSYSMIRTGENLSEYWGIDIDIENVAFTPTQALEIVKKAEYGDMVMLDEQIRTFGKGSGAERETLSTVEKNVGKKRILFLFASPDLKSHEHRYYFETWRAGNTKPFDPNVQLERQWNYTQLIAYNRDGQVLGHMVTGKPQNEAFLREYEKRKDEHIERISQMKGSDRYTLIGKYSEDLLKDRNFIQRFLRATKRNKDTLVREFLGGIAVTTDELKDISSAIEEKVETRTEFQDLVIEVAVEQALKEKLIKEKVKAEVKAKLSG